MVAWLLSSPLLLAQVAPGRYIVELSGPPAGRAAQKATRRAMVEAEQQQVRRALEARRAEVVDSVGTVANALLVAAGPEAAADLAATLGVARVYPVYLLRRDVDRAVILHRVAEARQRTGGEATGAGVKIGIIDTGIDAEHPAFQDPGLPVPEGFPRAGQPTDLAFTNSKVIVARSYASLLGSPEESARDGDGHGTAVAMAAAGVAHQGLLGPISGVAPKAWLGNYKVFTAQSALTRSDVVLKALDDAVADGMEVINLSLGSAVAPRPSDDPLVAAIERAAAAGALVIVSAGNLGPDPNTVGSPGTAPAAVTVGASWNTRIFAGAVTLKDASPYVAIPVRYDLREPVSGPLADVADIDPSGTACQPLPEGSLTGRVALIAYGGCRFEQKLTYAQQAGAAGAVIYADVAGLESPQMAVGRATLPASVVRNPDGAELRARLKAEGALEVTLKFTLAAATVNPNQVAFFSSRGPVAAEVIKPDLAAAGMQLLVATQRWEPRGGMYAATGYSAAQGTSFAAPLVAGAAAVLKAARPGLTTGQYRSLVVNSAAALLLGDGKPAAVQEAGAGLLDLDAALRSAITTAPVSLSFGADDASGEVSRTLTVANAGGLSTLVAVSVEAEEAGPAPVLSTLSLQLEAGGSQRLTVGLSTAGLASGVYQGYLRIRDASAETGMRVPYWYAVRAPAPRYITVLDHALQGVPGQPLRLWMRVTDPAGLAVAGVEPRVIALSGGGQALGVTWLEPEYPGLWSLELRLGNEPGNNVFEIEAGGVRKEVVIEALAR